MINIRVLEELRTKKEVLNYFKQLGKEITEEELDALKQSYNKVQENNEALTLKQLDDVAGGLLFVIEEGEKIEVSKKQIFSFKSATKPGTIQGLKSTCESKDVNVSISDYTLVRIEKDGKISSINNIPTQRSDYSALLRNLLYNPDESELAHIYIPESNPDMVEGSFKHYIGGKLVLVPEYMIDENPNLPEYLSTIYDSLFGGCHIDFSAVPCLPEKNVNCEDGKKSSICVIM